MSNSQTALSAGKMRSEGGPEMIEDNTGYRDTIKENLVRVKRFRASLEDWRELLAPAYGVLVWRQDWYPALICGVVTALFTVVWYVDPPLLTLLAVVGMTATTADYAVPPLCQALFRPDDWTAAKQREFERMCQLMSEMMSGVHQAWLTLSDWKHEKPKLYFMTIAVALLTLAWLGNNVNNVLLMYAIANIVALYPGMRQRGLIKRYMAETILFITSKLRSQRPPVDDGSRPKLE